MASKKDHIIKTSKKIFAFVSTFAQCEWTLTLNLDSQRRSYTLAQGTDNEIAMLNLRFLSQINVGPHCTYHSYSAYLIYSKCSIERSGDHSQLPQKILQEDLSAVVTCIKVHFTASFFVSESSVSEKNNNI